MQQDTTRLDFWYKSSGALMAEIINGLEVPIDIQKGINQLYDKVDSQQSLKLDEEIDFGSGEIRSYVSVDRIEQLTDKKYAVEISFATGPL